LLPFHRWSAYACRESGLGLAPPVLASLFGGGFMAQFLPVVLIAGSVSLLIFLALLAYRATVTRYEDDQLFLTENEEGIEHKEQNEIFRKVSKLSGPIRLFGILTVILAVVIIVYYVWDAVQKLS
jgi:hypothetical protein